MPAPQERGSWINGWKLLHRNKIEARARSIAGLNSDEQNFITSEGSRWAIVELLSWVEFKWLNSGMMGMLSKYIQAAMHRATYDILEDDRSFYGEIPELPGVYATAETCGAVARSVMGGGVLLDALTTDTFGNPQK
jgi:hypothetical protein